MNTLKNIQKVSLIFFVVLGLAHIVSGLMAENNYSEAIATIINKTLDIPFAFVALIYGAVSLKLSIAREDTKNTILNVVLLLGIIGIIGTLIYINFFIPDINAR